MSRGSPSFPGLLQRDARRGIHDGSRGVRQGDREVRQRLFIHIRECNRWTRNVLAKDLRCCHVALYKNQLIFTGRKVFGENSANKISVNLDLITSDQYAQAYLDYFFSDKGPITKLENYFVEANARQRKQRTPSERQTKTGTGKESWNSDEETREERKVPEDAEEGSLKLSIVETQPHEAQ